jgi:DNA polymerase I-like protein with 3'-5' exonuclease and polymerase domains
MKQPKPVTVDFETFGIEGRPKYPPMPVGVSIKYPGKKSRYYAWGHPTGNNCCWSDGAAELKKAWAHKDGVLFQNGKFDVDVAEVHFGLPIPAWDKIHDTMFLLFLDDPHQMELGLKPSATRLLGLPADEQDAVGEWLIANQPVKGVKISKSKSSEHYFGRYIAYAPGDLVGKYANGDVDRTEAIFNLLWKKTLDRDMLVSYDRERKLMPILLEMERQGLQMDHKRLADDVAMYNDWRVKIDAWIIKTLKADADINLDSGAQLVEAMVNAGKADPDLLPKTPTGKFQTNKEALLQGDPAQHLFEHLHAAMAQHGQRVWWSDLYDLEPNQVAVW